MVRNNKGQFVRKETRTLRMVTDQSNIVAFALFVVISSLLLG